MALMEDPMHGVPTSNVQFWYGEEDFIYYDVTGVNQLSSYLRSLYSKHNNEIYGLYMLNQGIYRRGNSQVVLNFTTKYIYCFT